MQASADDNAWSSENSCQKVRDSCRAWMAEAKHQKAVQIQAPGLKTVAQDILSQSSSSSSSPLSIEWDEEGWHYQPNPKLPPRVAMERLALYILAMDAINFCFWPSHSSKSEAEDNFEYEHLAMAMARMALQDEDEQLGLMPPTQLSPEYIFAPSRLASLAASEMTSLFDEHLANLAKGSHKSKITQLDNTETRCQLWNEVGRVLMEQWDGSILKFLQIRDDLSSELSAPQLVDRVVESFPGFRDCVAWPPNNDRYLYLYKRAQICVGDWNASLKLRLKNLDQVTTFADYRVPQLLRHFGVLRYGSDLAEKVDKEQEIEKGSLEELSIRAGTVVAVEDLVAELQKQQELQQKTGEASAQAVFTAVTVDWYLWQLGEKLHNQGSLKPHHKTRTTFY